MKALTIKFILLIGTLLYPIQAAMISCGFLISIDLVMALIAAKRNGIKIESRKLKFTLVKMLVYQLLIISAFIAQTYLVEWIPMVKITLAFIAITEFTSIGENFQKITGLPFIKYIKEWLQQKLNKIKD